MLNSENRFNTYNTTLKWRNLQGYMLRKSFRKERNFVRKGRKVQECYEALLKKLKTDLADKDTVVVLRERNIELRKLFEEAKTSALADRVTIGEIRKKYVELECEVKKLKEKCVDDRNELEVLRKKNGELDNEVLELKQKRVEDGNAIDDVIKRKNCELEAKVLELEILNEKWLNDRNALDELRSKLKEIVNKNFATINELRNENIKLVDEKRKVEILFESLNTEFRGLHERNARLEDVEASQVDHVANAPVATPHVSDGTNEKKRNSKPLHVKDVKKAKVRSSVRLRTLKNKMIDGPGKDASSPLVIEDGDEVDGIDDGTRE